MTIRVSSNSSVRDVPGVEVVGAGDMDHVTSAAAQPFAVPALPLNDLISARDAVPAAGLDHNRTLDI